MEEGGVATSMSQEETLKRTSCRKRKKKARITEDTNFLIFIYFLTAIQVETLLKGPHGARMIHTGPDTRLDMESGDLGE